jgi:tetratricopeptide (TPR) repeat protein
MALVALALAGPAARAETYGDRLVAQGNEFFRVGNYFRASESYRCAVLEEPADGAKKIAFGNALFALGNYAYAAYSYRRGIQYLGYPDDLRVAIAALFPSRSAFDRAMRDVRRYAQYYPSDPHALTTIAFASYFAGDAPSAEEACRRLISLDGRDSFAAYILRRIERERGGMTLTASRPTAAEPVPATLATGAPAAREVPPPSRPAPAVAAPAPEPAPKPRPKPPEPPADPLFGLPTPEQGGERAGPATTLSREGESKPAIAREEMR